MQELVTRTAAEFTTEPIIVVALTAHCSSCLCSKFAHLAVFCIPHAFGRGFLGNVSLETYEQAVEAHLKILLNQGKTDFEYDVKKAKNQMLASLEVVQPFSIPFGAAAQERTPSFCQPSYFSD